MEQLPDYNMEPPEYPEYECTCEDEEDCEDCEVEGCECIEHDTGCDRCKQDKGCSCDEQYRAWKERDW
jgi:hypothetical protein